MRLKRENPVIKNERKNIFKNKSLFEGNQNQKSNFENNYLQNRIKRLKINNQKETLKEKNLNHLASNYLLNNSNVYKPNKKLFSNRNIKNDLERNNIYLNDIKHISSIVNNNINIDNKANFLLNTNHMHIKSENNVKINDNSLNNRLNSDNFIYNDIDDYSYNTINAIHYNKLDKKNEEKVNQKSKNKEKNISFELRHRRNNRDDMTLDDIDETSNNENQKIGKINYPIYSKIYKSNSPDSNYNNIKYKTTIDDRQNNLSDRIGETHNNNKYINERSQKMAFNNHFNKANINCYNKKNRNHLYFINENNYINKREDQNRTANNFYMNKKQKHTARNINNNYFNYINNKNNINLNRNLLNRQYINSMTIEDNNQYSSYDEEHNLTYLNNNRNEGNKTSRRSKNKSKIKIIKNNNSNIIEYNLDISDIIDDTDEYKSEFNNEKVHNKYKIFNNINLKKHNIQKNFVFSKNIRPIITAQFSIEGIKNIFNLINKNNYNTKINILTNNNETNSRKHLLSTPKRSNSINGGKITLFNNNNYNREGNNNMNIEFDNISYNKILIKKRPKNEIPKPSLLNKRKNSSSSFNSNKNNIKFNRKFEISKIDNIIINPKEDNNKICFNSENEIVDYINRKFEDENKKNYFNKKLRFTGFVLSKKYKGKDLYEIRIEDDLDKINYQLKEEKVVINNKQVELIFSSNNHYCNINLEDEIKKLKAENEKLYKKEIVQNDLINKLDKEKQKMIEEIENMKKNIEESNNIIKKLNKDLDNKMNKNFLLKIENNSSFSINKINKTLNKDNIKKNDIINIKSSNNIKTNYDNRLDINKILYGLINDEKIGENINIQNIYSKSDNDINHIKELNNNKKILNLIDGILKIDEINKNLKDNEDVNNNNSINETSINDIEIYNQSHPRINDLVESEMSEKEELK